MNTLKDIKIRERFRKEAQVWIDLERHPYLVRAYFVDEISGRLYVAMEHIAPDEQGLTTLDAYLRKKPPDLAQTLRWGIQFCYGMEYAYLRGIKAHRDIKPTNIMITQDNTIKISDFGLAGIINAPALLGIKSGIQKYEATAQTAAGTGFGTPPYMAPEQFENAAGCNETSDVYSFGIVLYRMVSDGRLPFYIGIQSGKYESSFQAWYTLHCKSPVPQLRSPLFPVIQKCLKKEADERYRTFGELRMMLESLLKRNFGEVIEPPESSVLDEAELLNKGLSLCDLGKPQDAIKYLAHRVRVWVN
jgi:eukaryotic-like serine/threonine-protein kinase